jgi:hypothetical protein
MSGKWDSYVDMCPCNPDGSAIPDAPVVPELNLFVLACLQGNAKFAMSGKWNSYVDMCPCNPDGSAIPDAPVVPELNFFVLACLQGNAKFAMSGKWNSRTWTHVSRMLHLAACRPHCWCLNSACCCGT